MIHEMWIIHRKASNLPVITDVNKEWERFLRSDSKITRHLCSMAPPRQILLSGLMTLEKFRATFVEPVQFDMLMPPCIGIKLNIEEYRNKLEEYKKQKVREKKFELPENPYPKQQQQSSPTTKSVTNPDGKLYNIIHDLKLSKKSVRPKKPSATKKKTNNIE